MTGDHRITYRRKISYATPRNTLKRVQTPGGRLNVLYTGKRVHRRVCGDCGNVLHGLPRISGYKFSQLPYYARTMKRAYGGSRCHSCVRNRIVRAFLIEEHKIVKRVKAQGKGKKKGGK